MHVEVDGVVARLLSRGIHLLSYVLINHTPEAFLT